MGLYWSIVEKVPRGKGLILEGDKRALSKIVPLLWRIVNPWVILKVENHSPYRLYYDDGKERRLYKKVLYTPYVAVRLGPGSICFMAIGTVQEIERALVRIELAELPEDVDDSCITYV